MHIGFSPYEDGNITILGLEIRFYAICILIGALTSLYFCRIMAKKKGMPENLFENTFIYAFLAGVVGSRLWFVIAEWGRYFTFNNFLDVFNVRDGGLAIQGGVILGSLVGAIYVKKNYPNVNVWRAVDIAVPTILIAQSLGRWGNFFNHEVYGSCVSVDSFWYLPSFIKENLVIGCGVNQIAMPLFLIESFINLLGFILIHFIIRNIYENKKFYRYGDFACFYFVWYGIVRLILEPLRTEEFIMGAIFSTTMLMSIIFIIFAVLLFLFIHKNQIFKIKIKCVIFDLDGTILDNNDYIIKCYRHLFNKYNPEYKLTVQEEISFLGPPLKEVFPKYFKKDLNLLIEEYRSYGATIEKEMLKIFNGIEDMLKYLKSNNYKIALNTSKIHAIALKHLKMFNLEQYFDCIIGIDDVKSAKPNPQSIIKICQKLKINRFQTLMIGDSSTDILTGKRVYGYTGLVSWSLKKDIFIESQPDIIIENADHLIAYLSR